jgi:DinB superfamily
MGDVALRDLVFGGFEYVWGRLRTRVEGMTDAEYLWEPVPEMWTVRLDSERHIADWARPDPVPAPVTTIAWRLWHIADCLASYVAPHLGEWPLPGEFRDWFGEVRPALVNLDVAHGAFRERVSALGEEGLRRELGPGWGPYEHESWAALVLHAMDEVAHHGAEIALLRELYVRLG